MAKKWARGFYDSPAWRKQRDAYILYAHGICESCGKPGDTVHHKRELTSITIDDPEETLSFANLQLLCRECHAQAHRAQGIARCLRFEPNGDVVRQVPPQGTGPEREKVTEEES